MTATKIQPIAGYRISDPSDPELGFWFSETPCAEGYTSEPLYAGAAPAAVSQRGEYPQLPEGVMFIEQVGGDVIGRPTDYGFKHGRGIVHGAELFTSEQLRAYFDLGRQPSTAAPALEAPPAVAPQGEYPHEQMDAMALARYKVVPSHASMLWSHAVVAGDGAQQLYVGREVECQNMARKFAGAFLDGAFAFHSMAAAPTAQAAPALEAPAAPDCEQLDVVARKKLGVLLNAFGEAQWQAGRGVPCPSIEDAFEAVISAAVDLLAAAPQAPAAPWKDHLTARLVNDLRDCAIKYHGAGQLRERIAHIVVPLCDQLKGALAAPAAPAVDAKAHDWRENASYGGEICAECGAAKGSRRGNAPCAWPPEPLDVCTDPYNCARCKAHPNHRKGLEHAGISRPRSAAQAKEGGA